MGYGEDFAVLDGGDASSAGDEGVGGELHVFGVAADDEEIVGVVEVGGGEGSFEAGEAFLEGDLWGGCVAGVAVLDVDQVEVTGFGEYGEAVADFEFDLAPLGEADAFDGFEAGASVLDGVDR